MSAACLCAVASRQITSRNAPKHRAAVSRAIAATAGIRTRNAPLKSGLKDGRIDLAAFARRTELIGPGDLSSPRRRARSRTHLSDPTPHSRGLSIPVGSRVSKASILRPGIFSGR